MLSCFAQSCLEGALDVVEDAVAIQARALEVAMVIICDANDLLIGFHLLDHFVVCAVKYLNVSLVKRNKNEPLISKGVKDFKLAWHFLSQLQFIAREEIKLHVLILAQNGVYSDELDELGWGIEALLVHRQPVVIKVCVLFPDPANDFID